MSGFKEYDDFDALGLAKLVRDGEVSATELLEEAIGRTGSLLNELQQQREDETNEYDAPPDAEDDGKAA